MHPVIQHIYARKKGIQDNRKIAVVLYGGIMLGVRGAGALAGLQDLGLQSAIDSIYTMSSGFLDASYFLAGQIEEGLRAYSAELSGKRFLNPLRFWKIADISYLLSVVKDTYPLHTDRVLQNPTQLQVMLVNTNTHKPEYIEVHTLQPETYFDVVQAASSLPFIGHGSVRIGNYTYRDILGDDNIPHMLRDALLTDATDVLVLYNYPWQYEYVHKNVPIWKEGDRICEVCLWNTPLSRFETNSQKLHEAGEFARDTIKNIFRGVVVPPNNNVIISVGQ